MLDWKLCSQVLAPPYLTTARDRTMQAIFLCALGIFFAFASRRLSFSVDMSVSHRELDSQPTGQLCNVKVNLCLIEITSELLFCYQSMCSSCDTTALHVAVAALKVLGSEYSSARREWKRTETAARLSSVHCSEVVHAQANLRGGRGGNFDWFLQLPWILEWEALSWGDWGYLGGILGILGDGGSWQDFGGILGDFGGT